MPREVARVIVTLDPLREIDDDTPTSDHLFGFFEENRQNLLADLTPVLESFPEPLSIGDFEIRKGSVRLIFHIVGEIGQWTAMAAGMWQMYEYLRREIANRVRRFLAKRYGTTVIRVTSGVVIAPGVNSEVLSGVSSLNPFQRYLLLSHALLTLSLIGVLIALLTKVL